MTQPSDLPELVPARMVNEYIYCPRLFHLEWVQGQFMDNADTVSGQFTHRVVDAPRGRMPSPDGGTVAQATAVDISSDVLGVIARIDVVNGEGDRVRPVDYKKGHPPASGAGVWDADRIQVALHVMLLREAGYDCTGGDLFYGETRQRVSVEVDETTERWVRETLDELRQVATRALPPPPLVNSPKCPRCSLVGICLPDETLSLAAGGEPTPRRLLPRDPDNRPLYVTEPGASIGLHGSRVVVSLDGGEIASVRLIDVSQICAFGHVQVSTPLLHECFRRGVPVAWFSYGGWLQGVAAGMPGKNVDLRRRQVAVAGSSGLSLARCFVEGKVRNSRTLLRRNAGGDSATAIGQLAAVIPSIRQAESPGALLGLEGAAARIYFSAFPEMLKGNDLRAFDFNGRNRRPPRDPVNAMLSFLYALLVRDLVAATLLVGFDPYLGFFHRPRFGRPALALDLAEEFRPLIADSVLIGLVNNGEIRPSNFLERGGSVALTQDGRRVVLRAYERRLEQKVQHPLFRYTVTYRRILDMQARQLAAVVLGEIPAYSPMTTR